MPQRLRLYDLRNSRLPRVVGLCQDNVPAIAEFVNGAQERLIYAKEASDESWQGTFAEVGFELTPATPYITLPREIARIEGATVCDYPIAVQNQFIQYLQFGNGRLASSRRCLSSVLQAVSRNNAVTSVDMTNAPQYVRVYINDPRDVGKRVLLQGPDANGKTIYSTDSLVEVTGIFLSLDSPFVTSPLTLNSITGIQKDATYGAVEFYQVDPTTGAEILLLTMEPGELTASYRRYYFDNLPCGCCHTPGTDPATAKVQVRALAKMDLVPVAVDTDYLVLSNLQAIISECQSIRMSEVDTPSAQQMSVKFHMDAVRLLIAELGHFQGIKTPAVNFKPFGSADLRKVAIGMQ